MADDTARDMEVLGDRERITLLGPCGSMTGPVKPAGIRHWWSSRLVVGACALLATGVLITLPETSPLSERTLEATGLTHGAGQVDVLVPSLPGATAQHVPSHQAHLEPGMPHLLVSDSPQVSHDPMAAGMASGVAMVIDRMASALVLARSMTERVAVDWIVPGLHEQALAMQKQARNRLDQLLLAVVSREVPSSDRANQDRWIRIEPLESRLLAGGSREP